MKAIEANLQVIGEYIKVASIRLKGTMLAVFVRRSLRPQVSGIASTSVPAGILGEWVGQNIENNKFYQLVC